MMSSLHRIRAAFQLQPGESLESSGDRPDSHLVSVPCGVDRVGSSRKSDRSLAHFSLGTVTVVLGVIGILASHLSPADSSSQVWVSGIQVSQLEASKILAGADHEPPGKESSEVESNLQPSASVANLPSRTLALFQGSPHLQTVEFAANASNATMQGQLQDAVVETYVVQVVKGQTLTVLVRGADVAMTLLQPSHQQVDVVARQTLNWSGTISADGNYLIRVAGSGPYSLDVALTQ
ncbi:hypothetical protein IQ268_00445 [Oculatella sp. LEGE 06141]|uniref:hypothetical protein n=1 Tax=Oculatella sp. LEGE 06141 TaxID=1828648 RepID=UPI001881092F|nr:hypothetical protein [Oculatella sp. LEGE 06141]MBE9177043.1 hypothetical protein [Oculatella sp. LEGE 06141]